MAKGNLTFKDTLLIENIRKTLYEDADSCLWCPVKEFCVHGDYLCSEGRADEFTEACIQKFGVKREDKKKQKIRKRKRRIKFV